MAFASPSNLITAGGANSATANQASFTFTLTNGEALDAGEFAYIVVAVDNNATTDGDEGAVTSVTDSQGANWLKAGEFTNGQGSAQAGATCSIWYLVATVNYSGTDTVTVNYSNSASRDRSAVLARTYTIGAGNTVEVAGTATLANDGADPGSLDVTTANAEHLRVRGIAAESSSTTALTPTTNWGAITSTAATTAGGGSAANMACRAEDRVFTGTNAASDPTLFAADCASVYVAFAEVAGTKAPPRFRPSTRFLRRV